ncbi:MAG: hypothetical protein J07HQX50_00852 [Haloquadratum sp. J07HQX50]|jgi:hypothetical protein|nr:MAG: hypothetical protein J07HQX50_00852 [Haloquadratum sp. J07HQX50]
MATFEFGWLGLILVMTSGGFGAIGLLPFIGVGPDSDNAIQAFVLFFILLSTVAAILAAVV